MGREKEAHVDDEEDNFYVDQQYLKTLADSYGAVCNVALTALKAAGASEQETQNMLDYVVSCFVDEFKPTTPTDKPKDQYLRIEITCLN